MELLFKRGLHASLPTGTNIVEGAFYLTTDSHRLYSGIKNTEGQVELVDLNKSITVVPSYEALQNDNITPAPQEGDFAYIVNGNILAVYLNGWKQINRNTDTTNSSLVASGAGNVLTYTLNDSDGGHVEESIQFIGANGITTAVDADGNVTITGTTYELDSELADTVFTMTLNVNGEQGETYAALQSGANVTFAEIENGITISAKDTTLAATGHTAVADDNGNLIVTIVDTDGNEAIATAAGAFYHKIGDATYYNQTELPVYTKNEVDTLYNKLNAMSYKGTVSSLAELSAKESVEGFSAGWTYMVAGTMTGPNGESAKSGDLFIAAGDENSDGTLTNVEWTYVPSGDDSQTDTTYSATASQADNSIVVRDSTNGALMMSIDLDSDDKIELTSSVTSLEGGVNNGLTTTIKHKAPDGTNAIVAGDAGVTNNALVVVVPDEFVIDSTGHVASYKEKTYNLATYTLSGAEIVTANNVATVTDTLTDSDGNERGTSTFILDASAADNLNVTSTGNTINLKLEWGTF